MFPDINYLKALAGWGCDITFYVNNGIINAEQYEQITGQPYATKSQEGSLMAETHQIAYLEDLPSDSGWQNVPLTGVIDTPNGNYLKVRAFGPVMAIKAQFAVNQVGLMTIATLPSFIQGSWRNFPTALAGFTVSISWDQSLQIHVAEGQTNEQLNIDATFMAD